jgi:hypothetical protein
MITEIMSLRRERGEPGHFLDQALSLLTRHWAKASWRARAGILHAVDWLLHREREDRRKREEQFICAPALAALREASDGPGELHSVAGDGGLDGHHPDRAAAERRPP